MTGAVSYRVFDNGALDAGSGKPHYAWVQWKDDISEMRIVDPLRRDHHVTLGCAVENLTVGLGARGYAPACGYS